MSQDKVKKSRMCFLPVKTFAFSWILSAETSGIWYWSCNNYILAFRRRRRLLNFKLNKTRYIFREHIIMDENNKIKEELYYHYYCNWMRDGFKPIMFFVSQIVLWLSFLPRL